MIAPLAAFRSNRRREATPPCEMSVLMPTTSFAEPFGTCFRRALHLVGEMGAAAELVVVYDGRMPTPPAWLEEPGVHLAATGTTRGPAAARNLAAAEADGALLFFVDADVELAPGTLRSVIDSFAAEPDLVALFGAYDDEPAARGLVSQFRNLLHHHTHVRHPGRAGTFWSGCGAVRAAAFHDLGGFDERYRRPSIEDIELGMRLRAAGGQIRLDPSLRCKHHKRWTLCSMVATDISCRAVPWTKLILSTKTLPATLAIDWPNRLSGLVAVATLASLIGSLWIAPLRLAALAGPASLVALNADFYRLCLRKGGLLFAAATIPLHMLFFLYSSLTFCGVALACAIGKAVGRGASASWASPAGDSTESARIPDAVAAPLPGETP